MEIRRIFKVDGCSTPSHIVDIHVQSLCLHLVSNYMYFMRQELQVGKSLRKRRSSLCLNLYRYVSVEFVCTRRVLYVWLCCWVTTPFQLLLHLLGSSGRGNVVGYGSVSFNGQLMLLLTKRCSTWSFGA